MKNNEQEQVKKRQRHPALNVFLIAVAIILAYFFIERRYYSKIFSVLQPIIIGAGLAYLLNPLMTQIERLFKLLLGKFVKREQTINSLSRGISIMLSLAFAIVVVGVIFYMIIPELYNSIVSLVSSLPKQIDKAMAWYSDLVKDYGILDEVGESIFINAKKWLQTDLLTSVGALGTGVIAAMNTTVNIFIGIFVTIYVLASKDMLLSQTKKAMYAFFDKDKVNAVFETTREGNRIMTHFIIGKIIDSIIVGFLCFIVLSLFSIPYSVLVSVIVGVTNVIPFFGPYIGAIPSAALILLTDPMKGIYFIIIIIVLQQLDGNLLGPKIIGDTTGLSPFWVMFAIILSGGLFGLIGMIVGVPVLATLFFIIRKLSSKNLREKGFPVSSDAYSAGKEYGLRTVESVESAVSGESAESGESECAETGKGEKAESTEESSADS